jgi:hypothetical protein
MVFPVNVMSRFGMLMEIVGPDLEDWKRCYDF